MIYSAQSILSLTHFYSVSMQSVELTEKALDFLKRMFDAFDSDGVSIDKITEFILYCTICKVISTIGTAVIFTRSLWCLFTECLTFSLAGLKVSSNV